MRWLIDGRLLTAPTIQKSSPRAIGRMRFFSALSVLSFPRGTEAIVTYFTPTKGTGNKNAIDERHTIVVDDNAVVVTGFYTFTRIVDGKLVPGPSRFTMLVTKRGDEWRIAHHHSSPHVLPMN